MLETSSANLPAPKRAFQPLVSKSADDFVRCVVVYNPLDVSNRAVFELEYASHKPLSAYLEGLPENVDWYCQVNDNEMHRAGWALSVPKAGDCIVLIPKVHGGGGSKGILRIIATIVIAVAAAYTGGLAGAAYGPAFGAVVSAAVSIAGGLLISALLPPPKPNSFGSQDENDGITFGIDGPKNSSQEGLPVPVVYGTRRVGGNFVQLFTENHVDVDGLSSQFVFGQTVLSEGEIESITDIEINQQPASSFDLVEIERAYGTSDQEPGGWFDRTVSLSNVNSVIDEDYDTYSTLGVVDSLRVDITAQAGLLELAESTGQRSEVNVPIEIEYRPIDMSADWKSFVSMSLLDNISVSVFDESATGFKVDAIASAIITANTDITVRLDYRRVGDPTWIELEALTKNLKIVRVFHTITHPERPPVTTIEYKKATLDFAWIQSGLVDEIYEFQLVQVDPLVGTLPLTLTVKNLDRYEETPPAIADKTRSEVRRSYHTHTLPQGFYDIRWRRTSPISTSDFVQDGLILSDIGEIIHDEVGLVHTAWLGFKIKLSGQLSQIPVVTALVKGIKVDIYDDEGVVVENRWSDNPADIAIDMQLNRRYGAGMDQDQIDFPAYAEWREFCNLNNFYCDMVYDYSSNIQDSLDHVFTAGRAQRVSAGFKGSVAIERADDPVMLFGVGNIIKDTFEINYLSFEDRINEIEAIFPDKNDGYKSRSIRIVDDILVARGDISKPTTIQMPSITDPTRVYQEAWLRLQINRLVARVITFEAGSDAIACLPGDVIAVQHDMPKWEIAGRLASGSTTTRVNVDREVSIDPTKSYKVIVIHDAIQRYDLPITSQVGRKVYVSGLPSDYLAVRRLINNGKDWGIERLLYGSGVTEILLEPGADLDTFTGNAQLWDTDVIESRDVTGPLAFGGGVFTGALVDLATPLTLAPAALSNFMFGEAIKVGRKFRVTSISSGSQDATHKIAATEYKDEIYTLIPPVPEGIGYLAPSFTDHVTNLTAFEENDLTIDIRRSKVSLTWTAPPFGYAGVVIETKVNGGQWVNIARVKDSTSYEFEGNIDEEIFIRVTAFSITDNSMPTNTAPVISIILQGALFPPPSPTGFSVEPLTASANIEVDPSTAADFKEFRLYMRTDATAPDEIADLQATFTGVTHTATGLDGVSTYYFWIQAEDTSGNRSSIVGPLTSDPGSPTSSDVVDLNYPGPGTVGEYTAVHLLFDVTLADAITRVDIIGGASLSLRTTSTTTGGGDNVFDVVTTEKLKATIYRIPYGGGTRVAVKSQTRSSSGTVNLTYSDYPGVGDWTYYLEVEAAGTINSNDSYNPTATVNSADLDAQVFR